MADQDQKAPTQSAHKQTAPVAHSNEAAHEHRRRGTMVGSWDPMTALGGLSGAASATSAIDKAHAANAAHGSYAAQGPIEPNAHRRRGTMVGSENDIPAGDWNAIMNTAMFGPLFGGR